MMRKHRASLKTRTRRILRPPASTWKLPSEIEPDLLSALGFHVNDSSDEAAELIDAIEQTVNLYRMSEALMDQEQFPRPIARLADRVMQRVDALRREINGWQDLSDAMDREGVDPVAFQKGLSACRRAARAIKEGANKTAARHRPTRKGFRWIIERLCACFYERHKVVDRSQIQARRRDFVFRVLEAAEIRHSVDVVRKLLAEISRRA
jgi:hypothetical protein